MAQYNCKDRYNPKVTASQQKQNRSVVLHLNLEA